MKIAVFHDFIIEKGGGERIVSYFLKLFKKTKIFTSLFIPQKSYETFSYKNVISMNTLFSKIASKFSLTRTFFTMLFFGKIMKNIKKLIEKNYDIAIFSGFYSILLAPSLSIPKIYYITSEPFEEALKRRQYFIYRILFRNFITWYSRLEKNCLKSMDAIIALSRYTKRLYESHGIKVTKVIYPPVETKKLKNIRKKNKGDYFLFVGRLLPHKRPEIPLRVFSKIRNENLLVVGDGPLMNLVKIYSKKFKNIFYIRGVDITDKELRKIYSKSRAVIYLTEKEPFGLVPVEANSLGTPAIVSNEGGLPETIINKKTGLVLYPPYERNLSKIIRNFENYNFSQKECIKHARKFDSKKFLKNFKNTIKALKN
jgi:glycosyltransferase involved in cell wall biosynthesis